MNRIARALLWPFSLLYGLAVRLRLLLYSRGILRTRLLEAVVVSVGNLTAGGTGKTPMVIWLATQLVEDGKSVAVLTRGYRSVELPAAASGSGSTRRVSDEVFVIESHLGDRVPIGVGKDRYQSGMELERKGVEWFVLDDGFQHLDLGRDADLVLIDHLDPFGGGLLLPAGRLREPVSGLRRADAIVITRTESDPQLEVKLRQYSSAPVFYATTEFLGLTHVLPGESRPATEDERGAKFLAFCATGNPNAFFADLARWNLVVAGSMPFPDHYRFTQQRIDEIEDFAAERSAEALLCTEKDLLNFGGLKFTRFPVFACRIAMRPTDPAGLRRALAEAIRRHGKSA